MKIVLNAGEKIEVEFAETDGCITVEFGTSALTVHTDLPDTLGRTGVIYKEEFGNKQIDKIAVKEYEEQASTIKSSRNL